MIALYLAGVVDNRHLPHGKSDMRFVVNVEREWSRLASGCDKSNIENLIESTDEECL